MKYVVILKQLFTKIRQDNDVRFELRQLLFAIIIASGIIYCFWVLYVDSRLKIYDQSVRRERELVVMVGDARLENLLTSQIDKLVQDKNRLEERIAMLNFERSLLEEQYQKTNDKTSFSNVVFTLKPFSPVDIERGFMEMNLLEPKESDFYRVFPVTVKGRIGYQEFVEYLAYLEERSEVTTIGDLDLSLRLEQPFSTGGKIEFALTLGRVELAPGTSDGAVQAVPVSQGLPGKAGEGAQ